MFKNYVKTALRSLTRNRNYTLINISGLAVGIAVCIVIFIVIQYQTGFDHFHAKKDRAFRVLAEHHSPEDGTVRYDKGLPFPLAQGLKTSFPQLEQVAPIYASHDDEIQVLNPNGTPVKKIKEQRGVFYTSPSFFSIFDFPLLAGSYEALKDPNKVLLVKETAETYFGDWRSAMGGTIMLRGYYRIGSALFQFPPIALKVAGVLESIPPNTDFQMKVVVSYGTDFTGDAQYGLAQPDWKQSAPDLGCFVLLPENLNAESFNQMLKAYAKKAQPESVKDSYLVQPVGDIHYDTQAGNYSNKVVSPSLINMLWLIAGFILLIACVNFINLSTAQAVNRAREVGVRKVLGSNRYQLRNQFLAETFLLVAGAVVLASIITVWVLPFITRLLELQLPVGTLLNPSVLVFLFSLTIIVTLLAGFYPSVVMSRFSPISALRSKLTNNSIGGLSLRRGLVVFQFIIAQALIIGTLVLVKQMKHFTDRPLGFDKEAVVNLPFRPDSTGGKLTGYLRQQMLGIGGIESVSFSSNTPMENDNEMWTTFRFDQAVKDADARAILKFADPAYIPTYKLQLVAGRNVQPVDFTREFVVNESFAKLLGFRRPEDILNKEVSIMNGLIKCPVVGVVKDFNDRSFKHSVAPLLLTTNVTMYRQASVKLATRNIATTMQGIQKVWEKTFPDYVYEYSFLDEKIAGFYKEEQQLSQLYKIFSVIAIFLSCLGLYGLASFMAAQRRREVGIRKVLGASTGSIVYLFSREFVLLVAVAFAIASPISWYYMNQWLQDYAYRVDLNWWLFAAGGLFAMLIALLTISVQAIRSALANPVKSLKAE